jgi:subtilase family serine protease
MLYLPLVLALALVGAALDAQTVDVPQLKPLPDHHPLWANAANDAGSVPPNKVLDHLTVVLSRSPQQQLAFDNFLADQQNPASPDYHHWLTPFEVGERFGPDQKQFASVTAWLQSQGLHVNWISPSRIFIAFGGTAADLNRSLQTQLHYYTVNGSQRISVSSDPMIPETLAPAVKAIHGLYTIDEQPLHRAHSMQSDSPQLTSNSGNHYITPADFQTIYDLPPFASGYNWSIGIVGRSRTNFADFENFQNRTGTYFSNPTEIVPTAYGGQDPGPAYTAPPGTGVDTGEQGEATLDVMRAGGVASSVNLLLVVATSESGGIEVDAQYLVQTSPVPVQVMTISFGACESEAGSSGVAFWDALFQQAATEGISSFVSSGDSGASGCDQSFSTPPTSPQPNSPNYICSSSYVTCVGGTEFNDASNPSAYWSTENSPQLASALSYIPEGAWNEPLNGSSKTQPASSGGGVSAVIATPSWQTGTGVPAARSGRYTPDISFAASEHDGYFGCFAAGGGSCVVGANGSYEFESFSGTSAAAPSMAGIAAILNQAKEAPQGNLNPELYKLAASAPAAFHDVTVSSSGVSNCSVNVPSMCNNSIPSASGLSGGQPGYLVTVGYDEVTGLGSLDVQTFLNNYAAKLLPTVTVTPSATSITVLQPLTVSVTVSGGAGNPMPAGSVKLTSGNYSSAAIALSNGAATFNIPAGSLAPGGDTLTVNYTPDSASSVIYTSASGQASISVSLINPTVTVTPSSSNITTAQAMTVTVTVSGGSGNPVPTGTLSLNGGGYGSSATLAGGSAIFNIYAGELTPGSDTLSAYYIPDTQGYSTYNSNSGSATFNVTATAPLTPTVTVTPAFSNVARANSLPVAISVSGGSGNPMPTGSITLICGAYSSPVTALANGAAAITIAPESLPDGYEALTALYAPDSASATTYINASGSYSINVSDPVKSTPIITIMPSSTSINPTQSLSVFIAVASNAGFPTTTGSVTLTSGSYTSAPATLIANGASITIPAGSLAIGTDTLTVTYTPDQQSAPIFYSATNATAVTVGLPSFTITGTSSINVLPGATTIATIIVTPTAGFTGAVTLSATVTSNPANAQYPPSLSFGSSSTVNLSGVSGQTATLTITTTAPTSAALAPPRGPGLPWYTAGGATLACILFFAFPTRRRWRTTLGMIALLVAFLGGAVSCGGGGGGGGGGGNSGTTAGTYIITVTGASGTTSATGTVNLNVQ